MNNKVSTYIAMALDPIHVGAGGYRLGRVDNTIVREPGTNLPKIPGTSLSGAVRSYAAMWFKSDCAGTKGCGEGNCPICYTFGSTPNENDPETKKSYQGTVRFTDGQLVLFPVHSMLGPVWITTPEILKDTFGITKNVSLPNEDTLQTTLDTKDVGGRLNLSWLLLNTTNEPLSVLSQDVLWASLSQDIQKRLVILSPKLFSQVVNTNLEIRTSVAIDPKTGAAEEKKLFTYEALPRTTIINLDIIEHDFRGTFPTQQSKLNTPMDVVSQGLKYLKVLGIGGMGTRGFGRLDIKGPRQRSE
jgi:CRISPR-associated protein Cmr4